MRPPLSALAAFVCVLASLAARAQTVGTDDMLTIPQAIERIRNNDQQVLQEHVAAMQSRMQKNAQVATYVKNGDLQRKSADYIGRIHESVIADLQARGRADPSAVVSGLEVNSYHQAFTQEMRTLREAIATEAEKNQGAQVPGQKGPLPPASWKQILDDTAYTRTQILLANHADPNNPGPVTDLDREVTKRLEQYVAGGSGGGPGGGGAPAGNTGATPNTGGASQAASDRIAMGDIDGARYDLAQAAASGAADAKALAMKSAMEYNDLQFSKAAADARAALAKDPNNDQALSVLHFAQDRIEGSSADAPSATAAPGDAKAGSGGGAAAGADGGASAAASGLAPGGSAAAGRAVAAQATREADAALAIGDVAAARAAVERGLAADPGNALLLARRAALEARAGEWGKSLADAQEALKSDPKNPALLRAKALAQLRTKDYAGAIATANEMLELDPSSAEALALRGQAYGLLGKKDLMAADLESAARIDPFYKEVARKAAAGELVAPADSDVLFLMPGERPDGGAAPASPGRARRFGLMLGAAAAGGLLLALGLFSSMKEKASAALTRLTRTGPTLGSFDAEPEAATAASSTLIRGQFELAREIGAGGMGRVYEGTDRSLGRRVAIKKMRDELRADPRERARFVAEAKTVAALHHPNIVDIYAIAEEASDVYLVFEYVDGKTVHELVYARGRLEPAAAAGVIRASAEALEYAHSRGVIHRDMKLSNVMVDSVGGVKVMDFGIARVAKDALTRSTLTQNVIGTPPYMAPEQETGAVRPESDVYALAVCAYEMLAGELPFTGSAAGMSLNKANMSFIAPSRRGLPPAFDAVFAAAFQPDPAKRIRTPRDFAAAFEAALPAAARA